MKYIKIISFIISIGTLYILYAFYLREGHIKEIYQHSARSEIWGRDCKSTVVIVDNAPILHSSQESIWFRNKDKIINEWQPLTERCDDIVFVKNTPERVSDKAELDFWIGENQICLKGKSGGGQCIPKDDILYFISLGRTSLDDKIIGNINGNPIYIYFPSWTQ